MDELTKVTHQKTLYFEKNGEILSMEIKLENISPSIKKDTVISFLDTLYERLREDIKNQ